MAKTISGKMTTLKPEDILTGPHVLDIVSSGMYNEPMMILREFIQNATDSIDEAVALANLTPEDAIISVYVDGKNRSLKIYDNGLGVPNNKITRSLCSIAASEKVQGEGRGFRGIGRLGALGYCDKLVFRTKSIGDTSIATVTWDAIRLKDLMQSASDYDVASILSDCIGLAYEDCMVELPGFFEVTMHGVKRFHNDDLMHLPSLKTYIAMNTPVPYSQDFPFKDRIESHISGMQTYKTYKIILNDKQIYKPYKTEFKISSLKNEQIKDIKEFIFYDKSRETELARGWYAVTNYEASIPKNVLMRGVLVRQGNILVGGDSFLAEYFTERRFSTWCIGEIHVSNLVKVNARRDGFEHTEELEAIIEQFGLLGGHLSKIIREYSSRRSKEHSVLHVKRKLELLQEKNIVLDLNHKEELLKTVSRLNKNQSADVLCNIEILDDLLVNKNLKILNPMDLVQMIFIVIQEELKDPLLTSKLLTSVTNRIF